MAKIRTYSIEYPDPIWFVEVNHWFWADPYEPGAYHTIYPYAIEDMPPWVDAWQAYPELELGLLAAASWTSRPAMINDICKLCRYDTRGASIPRWDIYRGEDHPKPSHEVPPYPPHFVPSFLMPWWDDAPPGFGQQP